MECVFLRLTFGDTMLWTSFCSSDWATNLLNPQLVHAVLALPLRDLHAMIHRAVVHLIYQPSFNLLHC